MKELIQKFYRLFPNTIHKEKNYYTFFDQGSLYYFYEIEEDTNLSFAYSISIYYPQFYSFVRNVNQMIITRDSNHSYVLLRDKGISFTQFLSYPIFHHYITLKWKELWIKRCDSILFNYPNIKGNSLMIDESIDYYIGLLELSISIIGNHSKNYYSSYLGHIQFDKNEYYNPFNVKEDVCERDFGEYLKYLFLVGNYSKQELSLLIKENSSFYQYQLVLARVLYPNYYFDLVDQILYQHYDDSILKNIIERVMEFQDYVLFLQEEFSKYEEIKKIVF